MAKVTECWCCGTELPADQLIHLGAHDEIGLCGGCIGWLSDVRRARVMVQRTVPILATADLDRALRHYEALGFDVEGWEGGGYGFLEREGVEIHIGEPEGFDPAANTVSCYLFVRDADALYDEWTRAGVAGRFVAPSDTDYGLREGSHVDPDGNVVRFGSPLNGSSAQQQSG
jgi:catechol 2,3-dioxygenase-like lactoylglutathione lyase family enzyme